MDRGAGVGDSGFRIIVIPPLVSINRYKSRIAQAMSNSLGRPVRLSAVELRLLPRPEFVITDLTVDEDPSYGAEPVLHANYGDGSDTAVLALARTAGDQPDQRR